MGVPICHRLVVIWKTWWEYKLSEAVWSTIREAPQCLRVCLHTLLKFTFGIDTAADWFCHLLEHSYSFVRNDWTTVMSCYGWGGIHKPDRWFLHHYDDVRMGAIASQITSLVIVYSAFYSGVDQRKHQSYASLAFVWGIHRDRWIPRTKGQLRGKCFHLMTSSCKRLLMPNIFFVCGWLG